MRYIIVCKDQSAFYTNYYVCENHWTDDLFCVIDLLNDLVTFDGQSWKGVDYDHL